MGRDCRRDLWPTGFIGGSASGGGVLWFGLLGAACLAILIALIGLSAFQAHRDPKLAWAAFLVPAVGSLMSLAGLYGTLAGPGDTPILFGVSAWGLSLLGILATSIGSILFGLATVRARVLSSRAATALAISSATFTFIGLLGIGGSGPTALGQAALAASILAFGGSWAWLGATALGRGPIRAVAPA